MAQILIVDDDLTILQVASVILERFGFSTISADNGRDALTLLQTRDIDVLLTDLWMPGMSGTELIEEARRRRPDLPVCCMTAHIPFPTKLRVLTISKPFSPRDLITALRLVLKSRSRGRTQMGASSSGILSRRIKSANTRSNRAVRVRLNVPDV